MPSVFRHWKNSPMKLPTEAELIEMENRALVIVEAQQFVRLKMADTTFKYTLKSIVERLEQLQEDFDTLIALARDPSQLLRHIPDDDERWRAYRAIDRAIHPLRTSVPEPAPSVRPKRKKAKS